MFKTKKYSNNRKVAEAVSRILSYHRRSSFLPLFFPNPFAETPGVVTATGGFSISEKYRIHPGTFLDFSSPCGIIKSDYL